jgi:UDP-glucose 4-epimerase
MKKILVTGSNGYVGHNLVKALQMKGYYVVGLDRVNREVNLGDEFIHQDILDNNRIDGEYDTVIHLAALVQVGMGQKAAMDYYRTNVVGTMNMLERVDYKNFIFASTCQAQSSNVYGTSKRFAEGIIRQYSQLNDKKYTIFRFGNVVGGENLTNTDGLMYNLNKARETGVFHLYGDDYLTEDGSAERDYVHVHEICHAIEKAIVHPSCVPLAEIQPAYEYLGRTKMTTVKQCIKAYKKVNNCDFDVILKPKREGDVGTVNTAFQVSPYMPLNVYTLEGMMKV